MRFTPVLPGFPDSCDWCGVVFDIAEQVASDFEIVHDILGNYVTSDFATKFDILNTVTSDFAIKYDILNTVFSDFATVQDIRQLVNGDFEVAISSDFEILYDMAGSVFSDFTVVFDIGSSRTVRARGSLNLGLRLKL